MTIQFKKLQLKMRNDRILRCTAVALIASCLTCWAQEKRKIIIDQDAAGPAGTDQQSMLLLIQSPQTEVLGITVVTGDQWLMEEVAHTLRMLELIGRTDIPVVPGAEYPLVRRKKDTEQWERRFGSVPWLGAWTPRFYHPPDQLGEMPEGRPATKPADEDAAHFLLRMVHKFPNQVTIYEGGPMTNLALAISIDPAFAGWQKSWSSWEAASIRGLTIPSSLTLEPTNSISGSIRKRLDIVLERHGRKLVCTPVDISVKTRLTADLINRIKAGELSGGALPGKICAASRQLTLFGG